MQLHCIPFWRNTHPDYLYISDFKGFDADEPSIRTGACTHQSLRGLGTADGSAACQQHRADHVKSCDVGCWTDRAQLIQSGLPQVGMDML